MDINFSSQSVGYIDDNIGYFDVFNNVKISVGGAEVCAFGDEDEQDDDCIEDAYDWNDFDLDVCEANYQDGEDSDEDIEEFDDCIETADNELNDALWDC